MKILKYRCTFMKYKYIYIISSGSIRLKLKPYSIHYVLSLQLVLSFKYQKDLSKTTNVNICLNVLLLSFLNIRLLKIEL